MNRTFAPAALLIAGLLFAACDESPTAPAPKGPSLLTTPLREGVFQVRGDTLIQAMDTRKVLLCNSPGGHWEDWPGDTDTSRFFIRNDTLFLTELPERPPVSRGQYDSPDFVAGGYEILVRQGVGDGLIGRWRHQGNKYYVKAGKPSDSTQAFIDKMNIHMTRYAELAVTEWEFASGEFRSASRIFQAELAIADWNGLIDISDYRALDHYEIQLRALDECRVEFKGLKNKETVIVHYRGGDWLHGGNWVDYVSDNPQHAPYTVGAEPGKCPSPETVKPWFLDFVSANAKE